MRSEHPTTGDEWDAFTGWRKVLIWKPGQRKRIKQRSHRMDRRKAHSYLLSLTLSDF